MKIGIITDIHSNVVALRAVMDRLNACGCDKILCCGDILGIGPCPEEAVSILRNMLNFAAVGGNHEDYLVEGLSGEVPFSHHMDQNEMDQHKWEHARLSQDSIAFINGLPKRLDFNIEGFHITLLHYCMNEEGHYIRFKKNPSPEDLKEMFSDVDADIILYGHDHARTICKADKFYINVGSLGCPIPDGNIARAGILTLENGRAEVEPLDIRYDVTSVLDMIDRLDYPAGDVVKKYFYGV